MQGWESELVGVEISLIEDTNKFLQLNRNNIYPIFKILENSSDDSSGLFGTRLFHIFRFSMENLQTQYVLKTCFVIFLQLF